MLLLIDNYDSFTWNIYQYFCKLGAKVLVIRNDKIELNEIKKLPLTHLVISPGPYTPNKTGVSKNAIKYFVGRIPILGICLGHQTIAQIYGANIIHARKVMHGKTSIIIHNNNGIFRNLNNPLRVTRYHSLIVERNTLSDEFEITAWSMYKEKVDEIMGFRHKNIALEGVQFHPESILTEQGYELFLNFLQQ